jgi:hypothetical protein
MDVAFASGLPAVNPLMKHGPSISFPSPLGSQTPLHVSTKPLTRVRHATLTA